MHNCLYIICPTDYLEQIIRNKMNGQHYFLTSLGNTLYFSDELLEQITAIIHEQKINEITFILSEDNCIVKDGLYERNFQEMRGLNISYDELIEHQKSTTKIWQPCNQQSFILSYHLNKKIKELKNGLSGYLKNQPLINGKVFSKSENTFRYIYSDLFCMHKELLN